MRLSIFAKSLSVTLALPLAAAAALSLVQACHDDDHGTSSDGTVLEGAATDEALVQLDAAPSKPSSKALAFTAPLDGSKLPAATPATFSWSFGAAIQDGGATGFLLPHPSSCSVVPSFRRPVVPSFTFPFERPAFAHGAPVNGQAYLVTFSTASNPKLLRVFTTLTSYTPSAGAWSSLKSANAPIKASLRTAIFENNNVAADGGPFDGASITFTIAP